MRRLALAALLLTTPAQAQVQPFRSFYRLVSANGFAALVYDLQSRRVVSFRENLYRYPRPGRETRELCYDLYFGLAGGGRSAWLTEDPLLEAGYEVGTGLIRVRQRRGALALTTHLTAPWGHQARALLARLEVENTGTAPEPVTLFSLHNFHLGGGAAGTEGERIRWEGAVMGYVERGPGPGALLILPLSPITRHGASPINPFGRVQAGQPLVEVDDSGTIDDAVSGFERTLGMLAPGERGELSILLAYAPDGDAASLAAALGAERAGLDAAALLEHERSGWAAWHRAGVRPRTRSAAEERVAMTQLALLRMGQVHEPGAPRGQILASLPPGRWDISWLRDGVFAVQALLATGHLAEAEAALDFFRRGPFGAYQSYLGGRAYGLSVARYYGNGEEESDWNASGPNVELDGFGLFLAAAARYGETTPGRRWLSGQAEAIDTLVAQVLVDQRDPETGLIAADSSIWESHWDNGGRQRWAFTSGAAARGLAAWARARSGAPGADHFRAAAAELQAAIRRHLVDPASGALAASVEQLRRGDGRFADAQTALLFGGDGLPLDDGLAAATLDLLHQRLFLASTTGRGYKRNDDGDAYDEREWVVIDLFLAQTARELGRTAEADALLDWATGLAAENHGLVPELLDERDARYTGEVPMVGFGAGAYLLSLIQRTGTEPWPAGAGEADGGWVDGAAASDATTPDAEAGRDAPTPSDAGVAGRTANAGSGCACAAAREDAGGARSPPLGLLLVGALAPRRGRAPPADRPVHRRPRSA